MNDYEEIKPLGKGTFGVSWLVKEKATGKRLVLKRPKLGEVSEEVVRAVLMELQTLMNVHHRNIVQYYRHIQVGDEMLGILMEYCPRGSLRSKIDENLHFSDDVVIKCLGQLANALQYVHDRSIMHRNLKPENIFMATDRSVKIGDFGFAALMAAHSDHVGSKAATNLYAAPEVLNDEEYSYQSDLWSLGVVLYEVISLKRPFKTANEVRIGDYERLPETVHKELRSIVHSMLLKDPKQRPRCEDILKNETIQNADFTVTFLSKMTIAVNKPFQMYPSLHDAELSLPPRELDLAFALDCTGSMQKYIDATKQGIYRIVEELKEGEQCNIRLALVEYRDHPPEDMTFVTKVFEFTEDERSIKAELDECKADGGGDTPEAIADALCDLKNLHWRRGSTKVAVMVVDAPPHGLKGFNFIDGFPDGCPEGHDPVKLCDDLRERDIRLFFVGCEPNSASYRDIYDGLAYKTGGRYLALRDTKQLVNLIIASCLQSLSYTTLTMAIDLFVMKRREMGVDEETTVSEVFEEIKISGSKLSVVSSGGKRLPSVSERARRFRSSKDMRELNEKIRHAMSTLPDERPHGGGEPPVDYRVESVDPSREDVSEIVNRSYRIVSRRNC